HNNTHTHKHTHTQIPEGLQRSARGFGGVRVLRSDDCIHTQVLRITHLKPTRTDTQTHRYTHTHTHTHTHTLSLSLCIPSGVGDKQCCRLIGKWGQHLHYLKSCARHF